jgi:hypothetical protein
VAVSIIGPIGIPQEEAVYPQVATADKKQMNAMHYYVICMSKSELPPTETFWSLSPQLRVYVPDLEKMKVWTPPVAELIDGDRAVLHHRSRSTSST